MHPLQLQMISNERADTLRREADRRRLVAAAGVPGERLSSRLHRRRDALVALFASVGPQPQPCAC